jgi:hypothetical protein
MGVTVTLDDDEAEVVASALRRQSNRDDYSDDERETLRDVSDTVRRGIGP